VTKSCICLQTVHEAFRLSRGVALYTRAALLSTLPATRTIPSAHSLLSALVFRLCCKDMRGTVVERAQSWCLTQNVSANVPK